MFEKKIFLPLLKNQTPVDSSVLVLACFAIICSKGNSNSFLTIVRCSFFYENSFISTNKYISRCFLTLLNVKKS